MTALRDIVTAVTSGGERPAALEYNKGAHATGEGDRYEERVLALVFLRCLRRGLLFQLSANNGDAGKFDDVVLVWRPKGHSETHTLLVQLKHKTSQSTMKLQRRMWLSKDANSEFGLSKYCTSCSLEVDRVTLVLLTNARLANSCLEMFEAQDMVCVPGLELLEAGGELYKLNLKDQQVCQAVGHNAGFVEHFYLLCRQRNYEQILEDVRGEVEELLGAGELCGPICDSLYGRLREWMNAPRGVCLTAGWSEWQAIVDEYVRKEVTGCSVVTTRLEFCSVADVRDHLENHNPAWVRPVEQGTAALSASKVHQALGRETHIMVAAERFEGLRHKILRCWGPFCRWLVFVDDDTECNSDILSELAGMILNERRLVIVSLREKSGFVDGYQSSDVSDDSWKKCLDVKVRLNGNRFECCLRDVVGGVDAIKSLLADKPALLVTLARLSQPLRMGQELETLPSYYVPRELGKQWLMTDEISPSRERPKEQVQFEALESTSNVVIVEGRPGVGKSKMLSDLALKIKERDSTCWLLRINLLEFYTVLDDSESGASAVKDILLRTVFNKDELRELEYVLLQHIFTHSLRLVCLVDGFDEVCPDYIDTCLEVLSLLTPRQGKLLVTTRPASVKILEDRMGVPAHSLEPFNKSELEDFFTRHPSSGTLPPVKSLDKRLRKLLRIPLFAEMFASLSPEASEAYDIVTLYEAFFRNKFRRLYKEKWGDNLSAPGKKREVDRAQKRHEEQLMLLAASVLLRRKNVSENPEIDTDDFVKSGIVYEFVEGKPAFLHRTFAEHFLARWCFVGGGRKERALVYREAYLDRSLEFFLESFDRMAVKGEPLLESLLDAVLEGEEAKVEELVYGAAGERDACGRGALHLVVAHTLRRSLPLLARVDEAVVAAVGRLLGWAPASLSAQRGRWLAAAELAGSDVSHLAAAQAVRHDPARLHAVFRRRGYRALFEHVFEENRSPSGEFEAPFTEVEFAVSLISANMPLQTLSLICKMAKKEGHMTVFRFLSSARYKRRKEEIVRRGKFRRLNATDGLADRLKNLLIGGQPQNASEDRSVREEVENRCLESSTNVPREGEQSQTAETESSTDARKD